MLLKPMKPLKQIIRIIPPPPKKKKHMTKQEMIMEVARNLGFQPYIDDDGDICVPYQLKNIYFLVGKDDEQFASVVYPQFAEVPEGEETLTLAVCNKLSREVKLVKVYICENLKAVTASCEFFYTDMESLQCSVENSLNILGMIRSAYRTAKEELTN